MGIALGELGEVERLGTLDGEVLYITLGEVEGDERVKLDVNILGIALG